MFIFKFFEAPVRIAEVYFVKDDAEPGDRFIEPADRTQGKTQGLCSFSQFPVDFVVIVQGIKQQTIADLTGQCLCHGRHRRMQFGGHALDAANPAFIVEHAGSSEMRIAFRTRTSPARDRQCKQKAAAVTLDSCGILIQSKTDG
ncbi:MAG: hypothetical protein ACXWT1_04105 [Methylobacter sp.]